MSVQCLDSYDGTYSWKRCTLLVVSRDIDGKQVWVWVYARRVGADDSDSSLN